MTRQIWLLAAAIALAVPAYSQTTTTTMIVKDGAGASRPLRADQNVDGSLSTHNVPEIGGAAVSSSNPMPIAASPGTYLNGSVALSTASVQVFAAAPRVRAKVINNSGVGTTGGAAIVEWCRWGAAAAAGGIGSFALQPNGGGIDDQGPGVNQSALNCLAESGTPAIYAEQY